MIGGRSSQQDFRDTWSLNLDTFQWTQHSSMSLPTATSFLAADCTVDGQISIFGGVHNSLDSFNATRLNCVHEIWIKVPTLQKLAKQAVIDSLSQTDVYKSHSEPIDVIVQELLKERIKHMIDLPKH